MNSLTYKPRMCSTIQMEMSLFITHPPLGWKCRLVKLQTPRSSHFRAFTVQ
ncbi:hypothetical protein DPMN_013264 [Dreissena polymorpha]|uniref:Uncharacterized protein n=1 Tax=Dreissena polymorpha TaxID=45954 RepID=A0A9D4S3M5_DREPO|nr:hypothetical protein DPMN_013264 [Dreissena polymorpha]